MKLSDREMMEPLYVDNHLLVLNKSAGLLCQPNGTSDPSLELQGKEWLKRAFNKSGNVFLHAMHRLDRPVSGVVLFARTDKALSRLNAFLRKGDFHKKYIALVEGHFLQSEGILEHVLVKEEHYSRLATPNEEAAKKCLLRYRTLKKFSDSSLIEVELLTGRYHQIRCQCAVEGHPVVGDLKYGSKVASDQLFLHHALLEFPHPTLEKMVRVEAPLPTIWDNYY